MPHPPAPRTLVVGGRELAIDAVIDALTPHVLDSRRARMEAVLDHRLASVALGVEDLHHTHNGQACLRTAEALGLQDVVAAELRNAYPLDGPEGADSAPGDTAPGDAPAGVPDAASIARGEVNRKISMAAHRWIDLHRVDESAGLLAWARARDMRVFGAGPRGALTLDALPADRPVLLLFGNERNGLRASTLAACDDVFRIPMYGFCESFNVSVSVGITLAAHTDRVRARLAAEGRRGDLPEDHRRWLLARWLVGDVRAAAGILRRKLG